MYYSHIKDLIIICQFSEREQKPCSSINKPCEHIFRRGMYNIKLVTISPEIFT